jgi:RNA polymerase primary sigma factor
MATKIKAADAAPVAREEPAGDGPLMDGLAAAVKKMITRGRERGYVTYDEINAVLPPDQVSSEQIEDTLAMLSEQGINVVESEEPEENAEKPAAAAKEAEGEAETESE